MRILTTIIALAILVLAAAYRPSAQSDGQRRFYTLTTNGEMGGGVVDEVEGPGAPPLALSGLDPGHGSAPSTTAPPYLFFPQAGALWQDLYVTNFVDLGSGGTIRDYECTQYTYAGHNGHDSLIVGFREQGIGVPIFAAFDGTVTATHDGEFDQQVTNDITRVANSVTLSHASGYRTQYLHFKRGSVAVSPGQTVAAGTQLGLTGSSGNSSWPHLHLTSLSNNVAFEPSAGSCRSGQSYWANQTSIRRDTHVLSWTYGTAPFESSSGFPYDQVTRMGTFLRGTSTIYYRMTLGTLPAQSAYRIVVRKPDGTVGADYGDTFGNTTVYREPWYWFGTNVSLNTNGTWTLDFYVNATIVATAPFSVVSSASEIVNHPPFLVGSVAIDPASPADTDVLFCRVTPGTLYRQDPDYDLVRYRYVWTVNGATVRDVTSAALSDAIPKGTARGGSTVRCTATPMDDVSSASPGSATATIAGSPSPTPTPTPTPTLSAPTNLTATAVGSSVTISWTAPAGTVTSYILEAGSAPGLSDLANFPTGTTATTYSASGVGAGTYYVRVRAVGAAGTSAASNEATLVVGRPGGACTAAPGAPASLSAAVSGTTLVLTWNAAAGTPTSYVVEAGTGPGRTDVANTDFGSAATSFTASGVARGVYYIRLRARNACGTSSVSNEIVVTVS